MNWLEELKVSYINRNKTVFVLHENTDDLFETENKEDVELSDYLVNDVFKKRDLALQFNIGTGLRFRDEESKQLFQKLLAGYDALKGTTYLDRLPGDAGEIFRMLDRFIKLIGKDKSIALIIDHSQLLIPNKDLNQLTLDEKKVLVTLQEWAVSKDIVSKDISIVLLAENLSEINQEIVGSSDIPKIQVEFPSENERQKTVKKFIHKYNVKSELSQSTITKIISGLNRKSIKELFITFKDNKISAVDLSLIKKQLIEKENSQFFEFIETDKNLDQIAGQEKAKKRLREDAELIKKGKFEVLPMGYLIVGPVGTGKTYLGECFAGEAGIPVVKLKNFRERWVGASEANWEMIITTLKNLAPVVILVDEADAALGDREQEGDSGTSKRIFASLAETMGDTKNRGKLIWMLLTARPELLPIDLKRQGRAEVHIPLFYPKGIREKKSFFEILSKKVGINNITKFLEFIDESDLEEIRSGADIESVLIKCKRSELIENEELTHEEFLNIIKSFRSSISNIDINKQIENALAEVTDMDLLN